ncbi:MAG: hypothetical protein LUG15_07590, partial [Oscillospiraceae bacterium]|nr:hypothetical protein [Oscillospiraceae bacterium]
SSRASLCNIFLASCLCYTPYVKCAVFFDCCYKVSTNRPSCPFSFILLCYFTSLYYTILYLVPMQHNNSVPPLFGCSGFIVLHGDKKKKKLVLFLRPGETAPIFLLRFPTCAGLSKMGTHLCLLSLRKESKSSPQRRNPAHSCTLRPAGTDKNSLVFPETSEVK